MVEQSLAQKANWIEDNMKTYNITYSVSHDFNPESHNITPK